MIIGSGLIAKAFEPMRSALGGTCIYAAGVSNSSSLDALEYARDEARLGQVIANLSEEQLLVYFSTCSVDDPWSKGSRYVAHKLHLESLIRKRTGYLIVRLPQLAGYTPNPYTILNFLYARIMRSERFELWRQASRNIIDVDDAAKIVLDLLVHRSAIDSTINVANTRNFSMMEIVSAFEETLGRRAVYNAVEKGAEYHIDTSGIIPSIRRSGVVFDGSYLSETLTKYYASP